MDPESYQHLATLCTVSLNQHALDFESNLKRILKSIEMAKKKGARYILLPELSISGYSCEDHFLEVDTYRHSMECLAEILKSDVTLDMFVDVGVPVMHKNVRYNCRALLLNQQILLLRPKLYMANDGNYRELRWFIPWTKKRFVEDHVLPDCVRKVNGQKECAFGDAIIQTEDTTIGVETCEELFTPKSPHVYQGLDGVEIIGNGSASHHSLRKLEKRVELIQSATVKSGGCYLYSNQQGCDGTRLYFDGCSMISLNGEILKMGSQFSLNEVEIVLATVDLDEIRSYRMVAQSRSIQASFQQPFPHIKVNWRLSHTTFPILRAPTRSRNLEYFSVPEEISKGPACWLWDYLRRSRQRGFFLPLSGGADSGAVAAIVGNMCQLIHQAIQRGDTDTLKDLQITCGKGDDWKPKDSKEIASYILHTCYMGTRNSGSTTETLAAELAKEIGSYHLNIKVDIVIDALTKLFTFITGKTPQFQAHGGTYCEDIALQNIQARIRMVLSYLLAQTLDWVRGGSGRNLLVLGSSNVAEGLRGYFTKYDCSSADINPIGGISKHDLKEFLKWGSSELGYSTLGKIVSIAATAELKPTTDGKVTQTDEEDMGMTYDELTYYGKLRKLHGCGPVSMFIRLSNEWTELPVETIAEKVMYFFRQYAINRHKMTILTPSYHCESYGCDDNRYDLRPFLYNVNFPFQFRRIKELVSMAKKHPKQ